MSMSIPRGTDYVFTITVLEKNSYLPKNLEGIDLPASSFTLVKKSDLTRINGSVLELIPDDETVEPLTYANGLIKVLVPSEITSTLSFSRGSEVDDYYLKPTYFGLIDIRFADETDNVVAEIDNILIVPTGI